MELAHMMYCNNLNLNILRLYSSILRYRIPLIKYSYNSIHTVYDIKDKRDETDSLGFDRNDIRRTWTNKDDTFDQFLDIDLLKSTTVETFKVCKITNERIKVNLPISSLGSYELVSAIASLVGISDITLKSLANLEISRNLNLDKRLIESFLIQLEKLIHLKKMTLEHSIMILLIFDASISHQLRNLIQSYMLLNIHKFTPIEIICTFQAFSKYKQRYKSFLNLLCLMFYDQMIPNLIKLDNPNSTSANLIKLDNPSLIKLDNPSLIKLDEIILFLKVLKDFKFKKLTDVLYSHIYDHLYSINIHNSSFNQPITNTKELNTVEDTIEIGVENTVENNIAATVDNTVENNIAATVDNTVDNTVENTVENGVEKISIEDLILINEMFFKYKRDPNFVELYTKIHSIIFKMPLLDFHNFEQYTLDQLNLTNSSVTVTGPTSTNTTLVPGNTNPLTNTHNTTHNTPPNGANFTTVGPNTVTQKFSNEIASVTNSGESTTNYNTNTKDTNSNISDVLVNNEDIEIEDINMLKCIFRCRSEFLISSVHHRIEFKRLWKHNININNIPWKFIKNSSVTMTGPDSTVVPNTPHTTTNTTNTTNTTPKGANTTNTTVVLDTVTEKIPNEFAAVTNFGESNNNYNTNSTCSVDTKDTGVSVVGGVGPVTVTEKTRIDLISYIMNFEKLYEKIEKVIINKFNYQEQTFEFISNLISTVLDYSRYSNSENTFKILSNLYSIVGHFKNVKLYELKSIIPNTLRNNSHVYFYKIDPNKSFYQIHSNLTTVSYHTFNSHYTTNTSTTHTTSTTTTNTTNKDTNTHTNNSTNSTYGPTVIKEPLGTRFESQSSNPTNTNNSIKDINSTTSSSSNTIPGATGSEDSEDIGTIGDDRIYYYKCELPFSLLFKGNSTLYILLINSFKSLINLIEKTDLMYFLFMVQELLHPIYCVKLSQMKPFLKIDLLHMCCKLNNEHILEISSECVDIIEKQLNNQFNNQLNNQFNNQLNNQFNNQFNNQLNNFIQFCTNILNNLLQTHGTRMVDGDKLMVDGDKLMVDGDKLMVDGDKLMVDGDELNLMEKIEIIKTISTLEICNYNKDKFLYEFVNSIVEQLLNHFKYTTELEIKVGLDLKLFDCLCDLMMIEFNDKVYHLLIQLLKVIHQRIDYYDFPQHIKLINSILFSIKHFSCMELELNEMYENINQNLIILKNKCVEKINSISKFEQGFDHETKKILNLLII